MHYLRITIPAADPSIQEILIARLTDLGYEGFEQLDGSLQAFLPEGAFDAAALDELLSRWQLVATRERLEERNWNEEWEKNFHPVVVGDFCAIRAFFHDPIPGVSHELIITPKMSFGTGHHDTTYMMIQAMEQLDFKGKKVLDFGTGTGILAILAERLGAGEVTAIDHDDWCIDNAKENMVINHCTRISVVKADALAGPGAADSSPGPVYDVILANINKNIILSQLPVAGQHLKIGGVIVWSGLLPDDEKEVRDEAARNNLPISVKMTKGSWICLKSEKKTK